MKKHREIIRQKCPVCDGTGIIYYAYNISTKVTKEVSENDYFRMWENEAAARRNREEWIQSASEECARCNGRGTIDGKNSRGGFF